MAVFKVETKNHVDVNKRPRVYFTCHPNDFEKYFGKVCEDIFKTHDCAIYYTEDMNEKITEEEKEVDLGRNNLFVVPVTFKLLSTLNRAMDEDIPYAFKKHIPILPIMMEPEIDEIYSQPDKFGELQYLNPYSTDITEISYEEKLKKYLESVLISDELAKRIRTAFDAYIFLSYRKKDRKYANELMKLIHSNPECRDIAIWFDEFLTPGESFKKTIEKIIDDCKLFTLLVTPHLLEKVIGTDGEETDNYVISTELPLARKKKEEKGTDIFVVEMKKTDKEKLAAINIEEYVNANDESFRARLLDAISHIAISENNTPEHNFLIGLAYLEGIDVEVDYEKAFHLISDAAGKGLPEALERLVEMHLNGIGVAIDINVAMKTQEQLVDVRKNIYFDEKNESNGLLYIRSMQKLAKIFKNAGRENSNVYDEMLKTIEVINNEFKSEDVLKRKAIVYALYAQNTTSADQQKKYLKKSKVLFLKLLRKKKNAVALRDVSKIYEILGQCSDSFNYSRKCFEKSVHYQKKCCVKENEFKNEMRLARLYLECAEVSGIVMSLFGWCSEKTLTRKERFALYSNAIHLLEKMIEKAKYLAKDEINDLLIVAYKKICCVEKDEKYFKKAILYAEKCVEKDASCKHYYYWASIYYEKNFEMKHGVHISKYQVNKVDDDAVLLTIDKIYKEMERKSTIERYHSEKYFLSSYFKWGMMYLNMAICLDGKEKLCLDRAREIKENIEKIYDDTIYSRRLSKTMETIINMKNKLGVI